MNTHTLTGLALLTLTAGGLWTRAAQEDEPQLFSGPQPGEAIVPFEVVAATGDERDTVVDYVTRFGDAPTVYCFIHAVSRASSRAIRALDVACAARADEGLETLFVLLGSEQDKAERYGLELPTILRLESKVGISVDGIEGPGAWGLDREMVLTVTVVDEGVTVASFPLLSPNETDVPAIMDAVDAMLVGLDSFEDLRAEVLSLRADLRALEAQVRGLAVAVGVDTATLSGAAAAEEAPPSGPGAMRGAMRGERMRGDGMRGGAAAEPLEDRLRALLESGLGATEVRDRVARLRELLQREPEQVARFLELARGAIASGEGTDLARRQLELLAVELGGHDALGDEAERDDDADDSGADGGR